MTTTPWPPPDTRAPSMRALWPAEPGAGAKRLATARCGTDDHDGCPRYLVRLLPASRPDGRLDPWPGLR